MFWTFPAERPFMSGNSLALIVMPSSSWTSREAAS